MASSKENRGSSIKTIWKSVTEFFQTKPVLISPQVAALLDDPEQSKALMEAIGKLKRGEEGKEIIEAQSGNVIVRRVGKAADYR